MDDVLIQSKENTLSCISYVPNIGKVKKNEDLEINSDKFQITDDKRLLLYGNVSLDFPEGLLKAQNAELDRDNGKVRFSNSGEIFLSNLYLKSEDGYLNKDNNSIALNKGVAFEHAFDRFYAQNLGVNIDELIISQPDHGEQALEIADNLIRSGAVDIIVIDSVAALTPKSEIEGEMGDSKMGLYKGSKTTYADWCTKNNFLYSHRIIPEEWLQEKGKRCKTKKITVERKV